MPLLTLRHHNAPSACVGLSSNVVLTLPHALSGVSTQADLQGFFDPLPNHPKIIRVSYEFRGRQHYAEVPDHAPVVLPLAGTLSQKESCFMTSSHFPRTFSALSCVVGLCTSPSISMQRRLADLHLTMRGYARCYASGSRAYRSHAWGPRAVNMEKAGRGRTGGDRCSRALQVTGYLTHRPR